MRNIYSVVIVLALMVAFSACSNGVNGPVRKTVALAEPEQIGQQVFDILRNIDYTSKEGDKKFAENFMTYKEVMDFSKDKRVSKNDGVRKALASMPEEEWTETIYQMYIDMLSILLMKDLYWENIEYKDFTHHLVDLNEGGMFVNGNLSITHKDEVFEFTTFSIWNGEGYVLIRFEEHIPLETEEIAGSERTNEPVDIIDDPEKKVFVEQIGQEVFEILKGFDATDEKGLMKHMLSLKEINDLGKGDSLTSDVNMKGMFTMSEKEYADYSSYIYVKLKTMGINDGIVWGNIEYYNFVYEVIYDGGGEFINGVLAINHNDKLYPFTIYSFWDGQKYLLFRID